MSATKATLQIGGGAVGFNWLPVVAAQRTGIFERNGLEVDIKKLGTVDKATAAVKSGELNLVITPPEGAIRDCAAGGNLRVIAGNVNRLPLTLIANPRFKRVEDLKGAILGTSSMTEGTALYTMEMLRQHGLNYPGDYEFSGGRRPSRALESDAGGHDRCSRPAHPAQFRRHRCRLFRPGRGHRLHPGDRVHRADRGRGLGQRQPPGGGAVRAQHDRGNALGLRSRQRCRADRDHARDRAGGRPVCAQGARLHARQDRVRARLLDTRGRAGEIDRADAQGWSGRRRRRRHGARVLDDSFRSAAVSLIA